MVIQTLLEEGIKTLQQAGVSSPRLDGEVLLSALLKKERIYLLLHKNEEVLKETETLYKSWIKRRAQKEPVAYITGEKEFMSLPFSVCPGVLIPRPDTETLVEFILELADKKETIRILDLCTGSGAIGVSLAHYLPQSRVQAVDIEEICVKTARKNAAANGVAERVEVLACDMFTFTPKEPFDFVVSNPPYIPQAVISSLEEDVRCYEPEKALSGGDDGLLFYRYLAKEAKNFLKPGGFLVMEVGHDQAQTVESLLQETKSFTKTGTKKDLAGITRLVWGKKVV